MVGRNYKRGRDAEYRVVQILKDEYGCFYVTRSAGSHSLFDVTGFNGREWFLVQVKRSKTEKAYSSELKELCAFYERVSDKSTLNVGLFVFVDRKGHKRIWVGRDYQCQEG